MGDVRLRALGALVRCHSPLRKAVARKTRHVDTVPRCPAHWYPRLVLMAKWSRELPRAV